MKTKNVILICAAVIIFVACRATKNNATTASSVSASASTSTVTASQPAAQNSFESTKYTHGVYPPGNQELTAIQTKYSTVTLDVLQQGFTIYTIGKCINCHGSQNIYKYNEAQWKDIMDDMALKANISDAEKDAVYKYVLAIKAAKPK